MLPLPHGRILLFIGWVLIAAIVIGSLAPHVPSLGLGISDKLRHCLAYFILMSWFSGIYPRDRHALLAVAFVLMGAALELLQGLLTSTREMDPGDFGMNLLGIAAAFVLARLGLGNWERRLDR
jgi:hypothetical protein